MSGQFGVVIIGGGFGARVMYPACRMHPLINVRAVVVRQPFMRGNPEGIPFSVDLGRAISDPAVSLVVVTSPHDCHERHVLACLAAGKHVLCEKPLALSYSTAFSIAQDFQRQGVIGAMNYSFRFIPVRSYLTELIRSGEIGTLRLLRMSFHRDDFDHWPAAWYYRRECGGGALIATGSHLVDSMRQLMHDPILSVEATVFEERSIDTGFVLWMQGESGTQSFIEVSHRLPGMGKHLVEVHGTKGSLFIDPNGLLNRVRKGTSMNIPLPAQYLDASYVNAEHLLPVIRVLDVVIRQMQEPKHEFALSFGEGALNQRIIDAAWRSHRENSRVYMHG